MFQGVKVFFGASSCERVQHEFLVVDGGADKRDGIHLVDRQSRLPPRSVCLSYYSKPFSLRILSTSTHGLLGSAKKDPDTINVLEYIISNNSLMNRNI